MDFENLPNIVQPDRGFYYHYKHDPAGPVNNYAYEVMGAGWHTERQDEFLVIYRPLYETAFVYRMGKMFDVRPLDMFMETITKDSKTFPRFAKIEDPEIINQLAVIRDRMYGV